MSSEITTIATVIAQARSPYLVAIDGGGGAGKSVTARAIASYVPEVAVVEVDDFYRPKDEDTFWKMSPQEGFDNYFDWERLRDQVLEPASKGRHATYQRYDWSSGQMEDWLQIPAHALVIVEGCFTLRPELRDYFDFKVWIEASAETRLKRMIDRGHGNEHFIPAWMAAEEWYMQKFAPQLIADIVIYTDDK